MAVLNFGIVAHVDAGKTSLVERILFEQKVIRQLGSVDEGTTQMDSLSLEQSRGVSIKNSYTSFDYQGHTINLIDTPGHFDFVDEVENVLEILDGVVLVVSSLAGVQSQTKKFWQKLKEYQLPVIIFVNKSDQANHDISAIRKNISQHLSDKIVEISDEELNVLGDDYLTLVDGDEVLEEKALLETLSPKEISLRLKLGVNQRIVFPLVFGSAKEGWGIATLLNLLLTVEVARVGTKLKAYLYKVVYDPKLGKGCYFRLFSGQLMPKDSPILQHQNGETSQGKITQMRQHQGGKIIPVELARAGEIVIVYGLSAGKIGDTIGDYQVVETKKTPALFSITVSEKTGRLTQLRQSVFELSEEFSALRVKWYEATETLQLSVMGQLQSDIIEYELTQRYGLAIELSPPQIIYQETPGQSAIGFEAYTMPKPSWAIVKFLIEPAPVGSGYQFINQANNDELLPRYHKQIEDSLVESLKVGRLGWQVTDLVVTLLAGESHREHTHPLDFALATPIGLQDGLAKAEMSLLEPVMRFTIRAENQYLSRLSAELISLEGQLLREEYGAEAGEIEALVPLAKSLNFPQEFVKQTQGTGLLEQEFYAYQPCPPSRYVANPRRGIDPLDRDKWILYRRGGIQ